MTTPADCYHWQDVNEDDPPIGQEVVGMWIDSNGTTSTLPVIWHGCAHYDDHIDAEHPTDWTYDGMPVRPPHAWCANLDAHQPPTPPNAGEQTTRKPPRWAVATAHTLALLLVGCLGAWLGIGINLAESVHNDVVAVALTVLVVTSTWAGSLVPWWVNRRERRGQQVQAPAETH